MLANVGQISAYVFSERMSTKTHLLTCNSRYDLVAQDMI